LRQPLIHRLISMLCLATFVFGQLVIGPSAVRCTAEAGGSRIEFACIKADAGDCSPSSACPDASAEEQDQPSPCQDERVAQDTAGLKPGIRAPLPEPVVVQAPVWQVIVWPPADEQGRGPRTIAIAAPDHPPSQLQSLRAVILLV